MFSNKIQGAKERSYEHIQYIHTRASKTTAEFSRALHSGISLPRDALDMASAVSLTPVWFSP